MPTRPEGLRRRTLRDPVREIIGDLAQRHGKCWATERGLRAELYRRTGYICGERSIGRVIRRGVALGELGHERVLPNRRMADGQRTLFGTQHTWIIARKVARKLRRRAKEAARQAKAAERKASMPAVSQSIPRAPLVPIAPPPMWSPPEIPSGRPELAGDERKARVAELLAELERRGFDVPKKPPP